MFRFVRLMLGFVIVASPAASFAALPAPEIISRTYPDINNWYQSADMAEFSWTLPEGVGYIGLDISKDAPAAPVRRLNDSYESVMLDASEFTNGVSFVNVQFFADRDESDESAVASYRVRIDDEVPFNITADFMTDKVFVRAEDAFSGVALYEVLVEGASIARIDGDAAGVEVLLPGVIAGAAVEVRAVDAVGNEGRATFTVPDGAATAVPHAAPLELLVALLTIITLTALVYAIAVRRAFRQREEELKTEVIETKSHIRKIFVALRDEMADQMHTLAARKRLTKREAEVLESLTHALELSETLIQKELNDFKERE